MTVRLVAGACLLAAIAALSLARAPAARAQQPPSGQQPPAPTAPMPPSAVRAVRAYAALQRAYTMPDELRPGEARLVGQGRRYSYLWPLSQVLEAALALQGMPGDGPSYRVEVQSYLRQLAIYWEPRSQPPGYASYPPPPYGDGGDLYYDDNGWVGVPLMHYHRLTGDAAGLAAARRVFDFMLGGWSDDPDLPSPGGIFWVKSPLNGNRNTVSTAPATLLALYLYEQSGDRALLEWGLRMERWLGDTLRTPEWLYWDHIRADGRIDTGIFAYNQGAMIGVNLALARITGDRGYLTSARRTADAMIARYAREGLESQPVWFTATFARHLLALWAETGEGRYREAVEGFAAWAWAERRDPASELYRFDYQGSASATEQEILWQAAMAQVNALLAWDPARLRRLA